MSKENVFKFEEQIRKDKELQKKIEEAFDAVEENSKVAELDEKAGFEVIAPIAKEAGFTFTFEEFAEAQKAEKDGELDLKDMKAVAGGFLTNHGWLLQGGKVRWF